MESDIRKELDKEFSNIQQAVAVNEENIKNKKDAQVLAGLKNWLENLDKDDDAGHIAMGDDIGYIGVDDVVNKIKELQGE